MQDKFLVKYPGFNESQIDVRNIESYQIPIN